MQDFFGKAFSASIEFARDGSQFDRLFEEGNTFTIGGLTGRVLHTPSYTSACLTYVIGDAAFVGNPLFMPDEARLFLCHNYKVPGRDTYQHKTSVAEQRACNVHVHEVVSEAEFVKIRTESDFTLSMPPADSALGADEHARRPTAAGRR